MISPPYGLVAMMDAARGETLGAALAAHGLDTLFVRDGREARAALRARGTPGLLVTDLSLPHSDGFALLRDLRGLATAHECPAIAISAFPDLRAAAEAARAELGLTAILSSRISPEGLNRTVRRALHRDRGRPGLLLDEPPMETPPPPRAASALRWRAHDESLVPIAQDAARRLEVPVVFVALAEADHVVVPARIGVNATPEAQLLVDQVLAGRDLLVVPDAALHPIFRSRSAATMAGYAAAPIVSAQGEVLGGLCVADEKPLALGPAELDDLVLLARRLAGELELRSERATSPLALALEGGEHVAAVLDHLEDGVALVDDKLRLAYANPALAAMVDVPSPRLGGMPRHEFVEALSQLGVERTDAQRRLRVPGGVYSGREDIELARPRRRVLRWTSRPLRLAGGLAHLEVFADITAEVDLARERELLARADALTGLVNRRGGIEAIAREVARMRRFGSSLCFALIDIDELERVNDVHGQPTGDEVLRQVARELQGTLRGSDLAVRWHGDELLVLLPAVPEAGARVFAERVRRRIAAMDVRGLPKVTISCGVSELGKFEDVASAIKRADARLHEAKAEGHNRVR